MTITNRTFGIEIEAKGMDCASAARVITAAGFPCRAENYGHSTGTNWKVVPDGSVDYGFEVVSPVLSGEDGIAQVKAIAAALVAAGASVDKQCGLHVHVGANDLTASDIMNCMKRYAAHETAIDAFMPFSRRETNSMYCQPVRSALGYIQSRMSTGTLEGVSARALCELHNERYYKLNVSAFLRHGTLEFRQHSGTVSGMKMENWIRFCVNFVEASRMPVAVDVQETVADTTATVSATPTSSAVRANAIEKKFLKLAEMLDAHNNRYNPISASALAQGMEITENTLISYISQFRARYGAIVKARSGRGYYSNDARSLVALVNGTVAAAPVSATVTRTVRRVPTFREPGLFTGLSTDVVSYFAERAADFSNPCR